MLDTLIISDSSLSFPPSPPELPYVTKLSAKRVTSQSYKGVLSSIPGVRDIDVSIDVAETSNTFQITTASRPMNQTKAIIMDEQFFVHIRLHALTAPTTDKNIESEETIGGLSLLFEDQTKKTQRLHVSGVRGRDEEALVDLFVKTKQLTYLNSGSGGGSLNKKNTVQLPSVTKLSAKRVTSQSYKEVLSSISGVRDIDVSIDVTETSNTFQITTASRPMNQTKAIIMDEQFFVHIRLHALPALTADRKIESGETIGGLSLLFEDQTQKTQRLHVSGVRGRDEEALVDLFVKTKQLTYLNSGELGSGEPASPGHSSAKIQDTHGRLILREAAKRETAAPCVDVKSHTRRTTEAPSTVDRRELGSGEPASPGHSSAKIQDTHGRLILREAAKRETAAPCVDVKSHTRRTTGAPSTVDRRGC
eukprot:XP_011669426.1 PREDICTED: uncharacterized protein LOC105440679 [Strongylocentrotus purpuratus]